MKVVHLSNVVGKFGGGVAQVVEALYCLQLKVGNEAELWFAGKKSQEAYILKLSGNAGGSAHAINRLIFDLPKLFFRLRRVGEQPVVLHQHGVFLLNSLLSLTSDKNVKVVISPHGFLEPEKMKVSAFKKKVVLTLYEYWNLRRCSCFIACSRQEAIALRDFGFKQPIVLLPNGVDESMLRSESDIAETLSERPFFNRDGTKKVLLFLSRIHPFKGLEMLLRAVRSDKTRFEEHNWVLVIAGIDERGHEQDLKQFVNTHGLAHIVFFVGPQYGRDKVKMLDYANCFILPSKGENFGIVVIEALARGVPVVATNLTPWKELVDQKCGWWIERSEKSFANVFADIFSKTNEELSEMGGNGIKLVREKYTWSRIAAQSLQAYRWVISDFDDNRLVGFTTLDSNPQTFS